MKCNIVFANYKKEFEFEVLFISFWDRRHIELRPRSFFLQHFADRCRHVLCLVKVIAPWCNVESQQCLFQDRQLVLDDIHRHQISALD